MDSEKGRRFEVHYRPLHLEPVSNAQTLQEEQRTENSSLSIGGTMWGIILYIEDAYWSIPMGPWSQIYLGFSLEIAQGIRKNFMFTVLPFGLSQAPRLLSRVMSPIKAHLGLGEIWNTGFLDDLMFLARSQKYLLNKVQYIVELFGRFHLPTN